VGLEDGKVTLDIHGNSASGTTKVDEQGEITSTAFARAIARIGGAVDLVKLDCEGAEWQIFQDKKSWQNVKNLSM
jgi:hypothetical protein